MARLMKLFVLFSISRCSWLLAVLLVALRFSSTYFLGPFLISFTLLLACSCSCGLFFAAFLVVTFLALFLIDPCYFFACFLTPSLAPFLAVSSLEVPFHDHCSSFIRLHLFSLAFSCALLEVEFTLLLFVDIARGINKLIFNCLFSSFKLQTEY